MRTRQEENGIPDSTIDIEVLTFVDVMVVVVKASGFVRTLLSSHIHYLCGLSFIVGGQPERGVYLYTQHP